jgi:hypothetical protein
MKLSVALSIAVGLYGQDAQLTGIISEASKPAVPNAEVIASNTETRHDADRDIHHDVYDPVTLLPPGLDFVSARATAPLSLPAAGEKGNLGLVCAGRLDKLAAENY